MKTTGHCVIKAHKKLKLKSNKYVLVNHYNLDSLIRRREWARTYREFRSSYIGE